MTAPATEELLKRALDYDDSKTWINAKFYIEALAAALVASEAEVERLKRALHLIEVQDQGCGGNLRPDEIYLAMQRIARAALTGEKP